VLFISSIKSTTSGNLVTHCKLIYFNVIILTIFLISLFCGLRCGCEIITSFGTYFLVGFLFKIDTKDAKLIMNKTHFPFYNRMLVSIFMSFFNIVTSCVVKVDTSTSYKKGISDIFIVILAVVAYTVSYADNVFSDFRWEGYWTLFGWFFMWNLNAIYDRMGCTTFLSSMYSKHLLFISSMKSRTSGN